MRVAHTIMIACLGLIAVVAAAVLVLDCRHAAQAFPNTGGTNWWYLPATSPVQNPAWTTGAWYIDPSNSSGCASDSNTGTCPLCGVACGNGNGINDGPLSTWHELNEHRWACGGGTRACPRLRQNTTIYWLSSHFNNSDPVYFYPTIENGAVVMLTSAAPNNTCSGVLGTVTAKNVATPQLLQVVLPAGCSGISAGAIVFNGTHSSAAWTYQHISGTTWTMTQPLVPAVIPVASGSLAEVNTWTAGDSVVIYSGAFFQANLVDLEPTQTDFNLSSVDASLSAINPLYVFALGVFDPLPQNDDPIVATHTLFVQSSINRYLMNPQGDAPGLAWSGAFNSYNTAGYSLNGGYTGGTGFWIHGGALVANPSTVPSAADGAVQIDGDFIDDTGMSFTGPTVLNSYYIESTHGVSFDGPTTLGTLVNGDGQPGVLWGPGTFIVLKSGQLTYQDAGALFGTMHINTSGSACSICTGNGATSGSFSFNCGLPITSTLLKATCGDAGFGGTAMIPGSGTISNHL